MPHILTGGDLQLEPGVSALLRQWGMTCSVLPVADGGAPLPTIAECDAVILIGPAGEFRQPPPARGDGLPPAPYILLGNNPGSLLLSRDAWRVLPDPGPEGVDLKFALMSALDETQRIRTGLDPTQDSEDYLQFLGHELRSPLTAAKTALEVLQGELGGMDKEEDDPQSDPGLQMLGIALRNIKRLHQTVDWTQEIQKLQIQANVPDWSPVPVESLAGILGPRVPLTGQESAGELTLEGSADLLNLLLSQLRRAMEMALPGRPLAGHLILPAGESRRVHLSLSWAEQQPHASIPRVNRTHLASSGATGPADPLQELERLVSFIVSDELLMRLQARVQVQNKGPLGPGIEVQLITCRTDDDPVDSQELAGALHGLA